MKITLIPQHIRVHTPSDEELSDHSIMEAIYAIRKLQAAVYYGTHMVVEVEPPNAHGQVFLDEFDVWINKGEYKVEAP